LVPPNRHTPECEVAPSNKEATKGIKSDEKMTVSSRTQDKWPYDNGVNKRTWI